MHLLPQALARPNCYIRTILFPQASVRINTRSKISNWSPNMFTLVMKIIFGYATVMLLAFSRLCRSFNLKMTCTYCTEDDRVKVPSFQKVTFFLQYEIFQGAQWLSGRVLDSRPKDHGFKPHWRHCVVVLEEDTFILA